MSWTTGNGNGAGKYEVIEVEVKHCNEKLNLDNQILTGHFEDDGFYLEDGGELSWNWDIIRWRSLNKVSPRKAEHEELNDD